MYADYEFYINVYHGNAPKNEISEYLYRAEDYVDRVTFGRITPEVLENAEYSTLIGKACCACAEYLRSLDKRTELITQEKVGNYSVSYQANSSVSQSSIEKKKYSAVKMYLDNIYINGVGLMYRGVL